MSFDAANFAPSHFLWDFAEGVATVTLNRPERKNPLSFESYAELRDTFRELAHTPASKSSSSAAPAAISARAATFMRSSAH